MAQIPVSDETYVRLNNLKAKAITWREGQSVSWDAVVSGLADNIDKDDNISNFKEIMLSKKGKVRNASGGDEMVKDTATEVKEKLDQGEKVTNLEIEEKLKEQKRMQG